MMKMHFSILFIFSFLPVFIYCRNLHNLPCMECTHMPPCPSNTNSNCKHGKVDDPCGCCPNGICAKGENEDCEGKWNHAGSCGLGLKCERVYEKYPQLPGVCKQDRKQDRKPAISA